MKVFELPLEPIEMRYTEQWMEWFPEVFEEEDELNFERIEGESIDAELGSSFLDWQSTFIWKFEQLKELFKKEDLSGNWVFLPDGEMPGAESVEYFNRMEQGGLKMAQVWHAGSYDYWDLTSQEGLTRVGSKVEEALMDASDVIFVASEFHKQMILESRMVPESKVEVTGLPVDVEGLQKYRQEEKEQLILFTGRLSEEKGVEEARELKENPPPGYEVILTQEHMFPKEEYYELLGKAEFVFAPSKQETFGYGVVEGMAVGAKPVVPDGKSFTDFVPEEFRGMDFVYESDRDLKQCVEKFQYEKVICRMVEEMRVRD